MSISGLTIYNKIITKDEIKDLVSSINKGYWSINENKLRIQEYGFKIDFKRKIYKKIADIPGWLKSIKTVFYPNANYCIITEYLKGNNIEKHMDHYKFKKIVLITLLDTGVIRFYRNTSKAFMADKQLFMNSGTVIEIDDDARYDCFYEMLKLAGDQMFIIMFTEYHFGEYP